MQLFDLVNEKNELFRRQTELMYMKRDHRLEEEHADIEHQVMNRTLPVGKETEPRNIPLTEYRCKGWQKLDM